MRRALRFITVTLVLLIVVTSAAVASAAPVWKTVDITLHSEQQQALMLVSGELPANAKLPAEAELSVPAGMKLQWIGEILGGDPNNDPELKYEKSTKDGMDIYRFTLTKARLAQIEGVVENVNGFDGTAYRTSIRWKSAQPVPEVRISHRLPVSAQISQAAEGATIMPGGTGYNYYSKTVKDVKAGTEVGLDFAYTIAAAGAAGGASATAPGNSGGLAVAIILAVMVGAVGLFAFKVRDKMAVRQSVEPVAAPQKSKTVLKATEEFVEEFNADDDEAEDDDEADVVTPARGRRPLLPFAVIIAVLLVGFAFAGKQGVTPAVREGKVSRDFGAASPCQSTSIPFTPAEGVDVAANSDKLLKAFEGVEGVGEVTIDIAQSRVDMEWCASSQTEEAMRQFLTSTGLIVLQPGS